MARLKYVVLPGWVWSINDGDEHYIGAAQLIRLYGLLPGEYTVVERRTYDWDPRHFEGLTPLGPQGRIEHYDALRHQIAREREQEKSE